MYHCRIFTKLEMLPFIIVSFHFVVLQSYLKFNILYFLEIVFKIMYRRFTIILVAAIYIYIFPTIQIKSQIMPFINSRPIKISILEGLTLILLISFNHSKISCQNFLILHSHEKSEPVFHSPPYKIYKVDHL